MLHRWRGHRRVFNTVAAHAGMLAFLVAEHTDALSPGHGGDPAKQPFVCEAFDVPVVGSNRHVSAHDTLRFLDAFLPANALQHDPSLQPYFDRPSRVPTALKDVPLHDEFGYVVRARLGTQIQA